MQYHPVLVSFLKNSLTKLVLHHPDLQLNEAVGVETVILSHATVPDFVATKIQLAMGTQGSYFRIPDCILFQNVDQAPSKRNRVIKSQFDNSYIFPEYLHILRSKHCKGKSFK